MLRDADADPNLLAGKKVGVVGFGNQGRAQALCLRDAGLDVIVAVRAGESWKLAEADGFPLAETSALSDCSVIAVLVPDEAQPEVVETRVTPFAPRGALIVFAHGFALREGSLAMRDDLDVAIVGPLGPGSLLRARRLAGSGLAGLLAIVQDATGSARERALAYAAALGLTRAGVLPTTLDEEVVSDLFSEQVVLVGGAVELMRTAWEVLVEGGVSEEVAYYSCVQELKQILDLVYAAGPAGMRRLISSTAKYGGLTRGPRIVGEDAREKMREILAEIRSGDFAREWMREREEGGAGLESLLRDEREHPMEAAGRRVREGLGGTEPGEDTARSTGRGARGREVDSPPAES